MGECVMQCFIYCGKIHTRIIPRKNLFKSTMIYEVVNRGDIFALCVDDMTFTIISGNFEPEFFNADLMVPEQYQSHD